MRAVAPWLGPEVQMEKPREKYNPERSGWGASTMVGQSVKWGVRDRAYLSMSPVQDRARDMCPQKFRHHETASSNCDKGNLFPGLADGER